MRNNILLFILILAISLVVAPYFGGWYDMFSPHYGSWVYDRQDSIFFSGILLAYVFFVPLIFELFGKGNKNKWMIILLAPVMLFYLYANIKLIYIPVAVSITGCLLAKLIKFIIKKFKHPNSSMVVK